MVPSFQFFGSPEAKQGALKKWDMGTYANGDVGPGTCSLVSLASHPKGNKQLLDDAQGLAAQVSEFFRFPQRDLQKGPS